jgi:hypothetical protein
MFVVCTFVWHYDRLASHGILGRGGLTISMKSLSIDTTQVKLALAARKQDQ